MTDKELTEYNKKERERRIKEGYTYAQEATEWGTDPKNRTDLGLWLDKKKKGLSEMIFGKEEKAHSNIDDLILVNTLNRISHSNDALGVQALYQAKTKGGDTRHLLQHSTGRPTKYNLEVMDYLLRDAIKQNPEYSDTLTTQELPLVKEGMQKSGNIMKSLLNMIMGS
tara:strand:+ start:1998 stop:2501 length:504 start_codon:yes stop_codon:yes gene_type:complete